MEALELLFFFRSLTRQTLSKLKRLVYTLGSPLPTIPYFTERDEIRIPIVLCTRTKTKENKTTIITVLFADYEQRAVTQVTVSCTDPSR